VVPFSQYISNPGRLVSRAAISKDGGKSWDLSNLLDIGGAGDHDGAIEPTIVQLRDKRIWMLMRTTRDAFWESYSQDGGLTWSPAAPTAIAASHAPGYMTRLSDGRLILVWNRGKGWERKELSVALSTDDGKTWTTPTVVAKGREVTYPFVFENEPGDLWTGFLDVCKSWDSQFGSVCVRGAEQALR
jgi:predicted neuraminidase